MYDAEIIQRYATRLYDGASRQTIVTAIGGLLAGLMCTFAVEEATQMELEFGLGYAVGAVLGGLVGYAIGEHLALKIRFEAQLALCQVQQEKHLRALANASPAGQLSATPVAVVKVAPANANAAA